MSKLNGHTLVAGDGVAAMSYGYGTAMAYRFGVVKRVLKSFVELEDGSKWQVNGSGIYPRGESYSGQWLEYPITQEHRDARRSTKLKHELARQSWTDVPLATLEQVWALLGKPASSAAK